MKPGSSISIQSGGTGDEYGLHPTWHGEKGEDLTESFSIFDPAEIEGEDAITSLRDELLAPSQDEGQGREKSRCLTDLALEGADFSERRLAGVDFSRSRIRMSEFARADIRQCRFLHADLTYSSFVSVCGQGADFRSSDLCKTDFRGADLRRANLQDADLEFATFDGADLRGADLSGADLRSCSFKGARVDETTRIPLEPSRFREHGILFETGPTNS